MLQYDMLFKRKSVRKYDPELHVNEDELRLIREELARLKPLCADIAVSYKIVPREETNCKFGEYCLLAFSEKKENYLPNIGYLLEQLDLFLPSINIGACWYGFGRTKEKPEDANQAFAVMITFGKCREEDFRQDYTKAKRMELCELWSGEYDAAVASAARYSPSACNSQPWRVEGSQGKLSVFRRLDIKSALKIGLKAYFNRIDMGIFLCVLEAALTHEGYSFNRRLFDEDKSKSPIPVAEYELKK